MNKLLKLLNYRALSVLRFSTIQTKAPILPLGYRNFKFPDTPDKPFRCSPNGDFRSLSSKKDDTLGSGSAPLAQLQNKLQLSYTCKICNTRSTEIISKAAYTKGVVLVRCRGCASTHLIADNLNWFGDRKRNIEDILGEKGEQVIKIGTGKNSEFIMKE